MHKSVRNSALRAIAWALMAFVTAFCVPGATLLADEKPENLPSFDPAKGFRPAESNLTEIFLQIAASLEFHGSPEPYLRHMKAEHERVEAKFRHQLGRASKAYWPAYMTDEYFEQFAANWTALAPKLGLVALAKNTGHNMRDAILGTRGNGTMLAKIFSQHQAKVFESLAGKTGEPADFETLKKVLIARLYLDQSVIHEEHSAMEELDAVNFTSKIHVPVTELFKKLDAKLNPTDAIDIKATITSMFIDVGRVAQAELEAASVENALDDLYSPKSPYSADQEKALNVEEQAVFAAFLKERRFSKADFSALDKFYGGPYDRLSERGKDEMSLRIDAGMRSSR